MQPTLPLCGNCNVCFLQRKWQFYFRIKIRHLKEFVIWSHFIEADWMNLSISKSVFVFLSVPGLNSGNHSSISLNLSSLGETFQHISKSYLAQSQLFFCWSEEYKSRLFRRCRFWSCMHCSVLDPYLQNWPYTWVKYCTSLQYLLGSDLKFTLELMFDIA